MIITINNINNIKFSVKHDTCTWYTKTKIIYTFHCIVPAALLEYMLCLYYVLILFACITQVEPRVDHLVALLTAEARLKTFPL